ncbi:hypothetical protein K4K49_007193 [Colletotrichum sp. SAR 10_70]|nr:hypothetical protein K4K50_002484 [Colletotrichum sp. SAR 10_71]KAI8160865.1 hypothetical protein K4K49_007193 [Colletotrichum sp. SAR 10_70]KAI8205500.1 hypothetical protein K4K52_004143 [Colletotrichum sp. SAR 10_76]KAI8223235.1 hypothetical protein K4K53_006944 [Colletotrichum sp. SAR 10_77]KAI8226710.1 hypothetical protein K4K54_003618 [Colletotrichum sp. SAR 10_86]
MASHASAPSLSKDELYQLQQCERIIQFRDAILAGAHPSIKVPANLAKQTPAFANASPSNPSTPAKDSAAVGQPDQSGGFQLVANTQNASLPGLGNLPPTNANLPQRPYGSGNTEINPIFLEKSDDLIKAEIQLQRQRLERALRDEVDQRRAAVKASAQAEPLADIDLSDVLSKALTLVQATTTMPANAMLAANTSAASDSFDENSYYSSQHNSPDSSLLSSRAGNEPDAATQANKASAPSQPFDFQTQVQTSPTSGLPSSLSHASATHQPQGQASTFTPSHARAAPSAVDIAQYDREPSPQGGRNVEKRKGKKKNKLNKKAARQAQEAEPYIKPEPRSPSPMNAPSFIRPPKRQRRQGEEEPRYAQSERQFSRSYRDEAAAPAYENQEYRRPVSQAAVAAEYGYGREYVEDARVPSGAEYVRRVQSPGVYAVHTAPSEIYATSPASVDRYGREPTRYYRDGYEVTRMSTRPVAERGRSRSPAMRERGSPLMGPPKGPPARVVVDPASGRRYYEPASVIRQSAAPQQPEIIYERAPIRAESRRPGPDPRDDDVLYQRTSPMYAAPRRVVTQPEYGTSDAHRIYRQREYSSRPMPPPGEEYVQIRGGTERRIVEGLPQEYMMRATTVRPAETVRYELPREYGRVQSVRPEQLPVRDYGGAPIHPESRREVIPPIPRSYSVRPAAESHIVRREYSVRPLDQPYYGQPVPARGEPEVSYIERPRVAAPEVYYTEEGPRQVYR